MNASQVTAVADSEALRSEWDELAGRVQASPFLHAGWVTSWWHAFGKGRLELWIERRPDGRLAALLPLRRALGVLGSPTNWHSPEFGLLSESQHATRRFFSALLDERPRRVSLSFLEPEQASALSEVAENARYRVIRRTLQRSPALAVDGDWEAYERGLGKNLRADLKRRERLLATRGRVSFEVWSGDEPGRLDELLEQGFAVEASGWKGQRGTAIRSHPANRRFYTEVARWAVARGWLRLAFLRLDGRALAFDYCLELAGIHYMLKTGYDPAYGELSPGKLLRQAMISRAFRAGLRSYELLGAEEPWKLQWSTASRSRELVQGFSSSALGRLDWSLFAYGRPLIRRLRDLARGGVRGHALPARAGEPAAPGPSHPAPPRPSGEA